MMLSLTLTQRVLAWLCRKREASGSAIRERTGLMPALNDVHNHADVVSVTDTERWAQAHTDDPLPLHFDEPSGRDRRA